MQRVEQVGRESQLIDTLYKPGVRRFTKDVYDTIRERQLSVFDPYCLTSITPLAVEFQKGFLWILTFPHAHGHAAEALDEVTIHLCLLRGHPCSLQTGPA